MLDGEIHVVGGFDILSSESITHGDYYRLTWPVDRQWRQRSSIASIRARSLVLLMPNSSVPQGRLIYVAGGYDVSVKRRPTVVPTVHMCTCFSLSVEESRDVVFSSRAADDEGDNQWKLVTMIPELKIAHGLSFADDRLHVSETSFTSAEQFDTQLLRSYDFHTQQWTESGARAYVPSEANADAHGQTYRQTNEHGDDNNSEK